MKAKLAITLIVVSFASHVYGQSKTNATVKEKLSLSTEGLAIGTKAPAISAVEWLSEVPDLTGKFVVLDFWGTSCKPCISGFAHVNELHRKYKDKAVFIAATTDESAEDIYAFDGPPVEFYSMMQKPGTWKDFNIQGIPHMIVIDPKGIVRFSGNGIDVNDKMLLDLFAKYGK